MTDEELAKRIVKCLLDESIPDINWPMSEADDAKWHASMKAVILRELAVRPAGEVTYEVETRHASERGWISSADWTFPTRERAQAYIDNMRPVAGCEARVVEVTRRAVGGGTAGE